MPVSLTESPFTELAASMDEAVGQGYLAGTSQEEAVIGSRNRTACRYLFLLGYLDDLPPDVLSEDGKKSGDWRRKIELAIALFRADCGMQATGELDGAVWEALLELVSFDSPIDIGRWFKADRPLPALVYAAQVRLYAFGLSKRLPKPVSGINAKDREQQVNLDQGLQDFVRAADLLHLCDESLDPDLSRATLGVLLDQHEIVRRLAECKDAIAVYHHEQDSERRRRMNREFAMEFVRNVARIELWLCGYGVRIGSGRDRDRIQPSGTKLSLTNALEEFVSDYEDDPEVVAIKRDTIPGILFEKLQALRLRGDEADDGAEGDTLVNEVLKDRNVASQVLNGIRSLGSRLWDGIKRLWSWFKRGIRSLFDKVKGIAKAVVTNISRYIHGISQRVFANVRAAVRAVKDGFEFLKEKVLRGSDPDHIVIFHDGDFDFDVLINTRGDPGVITNLVDRLSVRSRIFVTGSGIVSDLLSVFMVILRGGIATGWFALMLALVKLRRTLVSLNRRDQEAFDELARLDELREDDEELIGAVAFA